jgi:hypothetical protein
LSNSARGAGERRGNRALEILAMLLLGVATVGTAWCGYQASAWSRDESELGRQSTEQRVQASQQFGLAVQGVALDATLVADYARAVVEQDERLQTFYKDYLFRAEFLPVLERWERQLAAGERPSHRLLEDQQYIDAQFAAYNDDVATAEQLDEQSQEAGSNGDQYVLVTLLLATALFFAGVTTSFRVRFARLILLAAAGFTIAYAAARIVDLPVN